MDFAGRKCAAKFVYVKTRYNLPDHWSRRLSAAQAKTFVNVAKHVARTSKHGCLCVKLWPITLKRQGAQLPQRKRASAVIAPFEVIQDRRFRYQSKPRMPLISFSNSEHSIINKMCIRYNAVLPSTLKWSLDEIIELLYERELVIVVISHGDSCARLVVVFSIMQQHHWMDSWISILL